MAAVRRTISRQLARAAARVPVGRRPPGWVVLASPVPVAGAVALAGWLGGGRVSDDYVVSVLATALLVGLVGVGCCLAAARWRRLAWPVLVSFAITAGGGGGYLLVTSVRDVTVREDAAVALSRAPQDLDPVAPRPAGPVAVARGAFRRDAHATTGTATVVRLADGRHVVTLTGFATDPGPDLRVHLVPRVASGVRDRLDLGRLKGNKGDQVYAVPAGAAVADYDRLVIWCRAFSVAFGTARLG